MKIIRRASERIVRVLTWNIWGWSRGKHQHGLRIQGRLFSGSLNMSLVIRCDDGILVEVTS